MRIVIDGCSIATMDASDAEVASGHIIVENARITAVREGAPPSPAAGERRIDGRGCLATPGLVNCHHHLYQWLTRGVARESNLFEWLSVLYPVWARIDVEMEHAAARAGLAALALSGCTTTTDHHYIFPSSAPELLDVEIEAAGDIGLRFHPCRGSMDLGRSQGGLPPDDIVESIDSILAATEAAIDSWHDASESSMLRVAVAPCSPFSVTRELMRAAAELARAKDVRLHTHLAETLDEEEFCIEQFGMRPVDYLEELGWLGDDVWLAHCIHLSDAEIRRFGETGTGVAHCPSSNARLGAGIAPVVDLQSAGAPVGLGVDGAASNESGELAYELRASLLWARLRGGPAAMTPREALALGTREGARCLGREGEIGSLEAGKLADIVLWRLDDLAHAGIDDPVGALVLGSPRAPHLVMVNGSIVVEDGRLLTADEEIIAAKLGKACVRMVDSAGVA